MAEMGKRAVNADGTRARGGSNGNERGGSVQRRRRREWLVATYRADVDVLVVTAHPYPTALIPVERGRVLEGLDVQPACRCYRCGMLLTVDTVSADRIKPGCDGGTYARSNIRPACLTCQCVTGGTTRRKGAK